MSHYYTKNSTLPSEEKDIHVKIHETSFHFITDNGVFSKSGLDFGSRLLIETIIKTENKKVLDLGCGYGPIGITYKKFHVSSEVTLLDINDRATDLAEKNASQNKTAVTIINNDGFNQMKDTYDLILTNPPIRTGKANVYRLFFESYHHLTDGGTLIFVMKKNQGALSAIKYCEEIYKKVEVLNKKSGYYIIACIK